MRVFKPLLPLCIVLMSWSCAEKVNVMVLDQELNQLLEQKNFFKLRSLLEQNSQHLPTHKQLYYQAFVARAFSQNQESNAHVTSLLQDYAAEFNDSAQLRLLDLKAANHLFLYEYQAAAALYGQILSQYPHLLEADELANYQNTQSLFGALGHVPPQKMHLKGEVSIPAKRNQFNHLMAPVKVNGVDESFIFDTGANLSTISEAQAKKMKLQIIEQSVELGSSTQINVQSRLAVADSFYFGDILFEHVVFLVLADEQLTFPEINYQIYGIIGLPVIHQLGEVRLHADGHISVPSSPQPTNRSNMFFNGLNPVVELLSNNDTLLFTFDTGAKSSELSLKYFNEHQSEVKAKGLLQTTQSGGVGGFTKVQEYLLKDFPFQLGSKSTQLDSIPVTLEAYSYTSHFDGNLGQDVLTQFNTLILNFKHMYVDFE